MSYRTIDKDGAAVAFGDGGEGSPIETDPLGGSVGTTTPYWNPDIWQREPQYPDLIPFNSNQEIPSVDFGSLYAVYGSHIADLPGFGTNWGSFSQLDMALYEERLENSRLGFGFITNEQFIEQAYAQAAEEDRTRADDEEYEEGEDGNGDGVDDDDGGGDAATGNGDAGEQDFLADLQANGTANMRGHLSVDSSAVQNISLGWSFSSFFNPRSIDDFAKARRNDLKQFLAKNPNCHSALYDAAAIAKNIVDPRDADDPVDLLLSIIALQDMTSNDQGETVARGFPDRVEFYKNFNETYGKSTPEVRGGIVFHELLHVLFGGHIEVVSALKISLMLPYPPIPPKPKPANKFSAIPRITDEQWEAQNRRKDGSNDIADISIRQWQDNDCRNQK